MKLVDAAIRNSTAVWVGIILTLLFGYLAFQAIPVQLNPTIEPPFITVETSYPGASAIEVEQEITMRQEEKLAAVENLREMRSTSREGQSQISLRFDWGVNKDLAGLDVLKKLNLVDDLPADAEEPQILTVNRRQEETVMWLYMGAAEGAGEIPIQIERRIVDDLVKPRLERVAGVGVVRVYGGSEREIHVLIDPQAIAARKVSLNQVASALRRENRNVRGGKIESGASRLIVRTPGQYGNLDQIMQTIITNGPDGPVRVRDIGYVEDAYKDVDVVVHVNGDPAVVIAVVRKTGSNTLNVTEAVGEELARLNEGLRPRGVRINVAYDASEYIWASIFQMRENLILGGILATVVLLIFLRSVSATLIIGVMIPVCIVGTFVLLAAFGRSVNVISLAGLAFAGGMVVDAGIVVIENIYRRRVELGQSRMLAARDGAREVGPPILISTLSTMAVFLPILFIQEEAGQLFRDIAYSITFAVGLSMPAAVTIVPMLASRFFFKSVSEEVPDLPAHAPGDDVHAAQAAEPERPDWATRAFDATLGRVMGWIGAGVNWAFIGLVGLGLRFLSVRLALIIAIALIFFASLRIVPPAEYLPTGNRNFVIGLFKLPSGMSLEGSTELMSRIEPFILELPERDRNFMVMLRDTPIVGIIIKDEYSSKQQIQAVAQRIRDHASEIYPFPDVIPIVFQRPVFGGLGGGKSITVDIRGPDLRRLDEIASDLQDRLRGLDGVQQVRPTLNLDNPELQVYPDRERLADLGLTVSDLAETVEILLEGRITSLYREGGKEYDLRLRAIQQEVSSGSELESATITTPAGGKVKVAEVARIAKRLGPVAVEHLEQERSVSLEVTIDEEQPLEPLIAQINEQVLDPLLPTLPLEYQVGLSGSADDLARTIVALSDSFILALIIIYLLMAALFRSFLYPFVIMFSVPLAMTGAFLGVRLTGVEFNVITMLGFILLAGVVVNNAILIVDVALNLVREGQSNHGAIREAVRRRLRPIFMTTLTTVLGTLPLALGRGSGAELYQGLGVAVLGGLAVSSLFTLILIPMLLAVVLDIRDGLARRLGREDLTEAGRARALAELDEHL